MAQLRLSGISKIYEGKVPVNALKNVNVEIHPGDYVSIVGPSGSGKTTLLNQLALLDAPTAGEYWIDQVQTETLTESARARQRSNTFAFIFQAFHLLDGRSVADNVALGMLYRALPESRRLEKASEALAFVGLAHKENEKVQNLSGGERQRVAIARAIASGAPIVVADEPTGNLDSKNSSLVMDTLERINQSGSTVIVVTHDPAVAARSTRALEVVDGVVTERGMAPAPMASQIKKEPAESSPPPEGKESKVRFQDAFKDTWRGLWTKPVRTLALIASVALGVALALTTVGLSQTAQAQVSDIFDAQRNQRVALTSPVIDSSWQTTSDKQLADALSSPEALARIQALSGVEQAAVFVTHNEVRPTTRPQRIGKTTAVGPIIGMVSGYIPTGIFTVDSGGSERALERLQDNQVVIGVQLAASLDLGPLLASPNIWIDGMSKQVVGILTDAGLQVSLLNAVLTTETAAAEISPAQYATAEIKVAPGAGAQVGKQGPIAWLPTAPDSIQVDAPPDPTSMRDQIESNLATMLMTLAGVALLAAVLSLTTSMTTAVFQRTGEFGLRRAIGARRIHVTSLVLTESTIIGLIGGIIGAYTSVLAILSITIARQWQPVLEPILIPIGIIGGILVGLIGGAIATRKAATIQPSHALRI